VSGGRLRPALLAGLGLALGLWGIRWGLPSRARLEKVLPPGARTPHYQEHLMASWSSLHESFGSDIMVSTESWAAPFSGVQRVMPGWTEPPALLLNSARSFYLRSAHEDEQSFLIVLSRMRPWRLELNPHLFTYGGAYIYSLGAALAAGAVLRLASLHTSMAPYLADPGQMASLYFVGRLYSVACFIGCGLLLLRLGRRHLGADAGFYAALLFLFSPDAVVQAHVMKNHMLWSLLLLWTLERSLALLADGGLAAYAAAGAASGLTVGAFLAAWPACLVVGFAGFLRAVFRRETVASVVKGLAAAGAASAAAFFAANPYFILDFSSARAEMKVLGGWSAFNIGHPIVFASRVLPSAATWPVLALILAGAAWALIRGRREPALWLCAFAFAAGLAMMSTIADVVDVSQARYFLGFLAVGLLLAGRAAADLLASGSKLRPAAAAALALTLSWEALAGATYAHNFAADAGDSSTHARAGAWIETNVPAGSAIGLLRLPQPSNAPYFRYDRYELRMIESPRLFASLPAGDLPPYVAVTSPDYDDRPAMEPNLSRYELAADFPRARLAPFLAIEPTATTADPQIDIYRLKGAR
jgi:hypothetical protein